MNINIASYVLAFMVSASPSIEKDESGNLSVATFNILFANLDLKSVAKTISRADADVLALQETNRESAEYLTKYLGKKYPHRHFRHARRAGGLGFISKRPLINVVYMKPKHGVFGALFADVNFAEKTVRIANVHLLPTIPRRGEGIVRFMRRLLEDEAVRIREADRVLDRIEKDKPAIVAGDFNTISALKTVGLMKKRGYSDSFASVTPGADMHITFSGDLHGLFGGYRLDYLFHTGDFQTVSSRVLPCRGSDHRMVVSKVKLEKGMK